MALGRHDETAGPWDGPFLLVSHRLRDDGYDDDTESCLNIYALPPSNFLEFTLLAAKGFCSRTLPIS